MDERLTSLQSSQKRAPTVGGLATNVACRCFKFGKGETRFLIIVLEVFVRGALLISYTYEPFGINRQRFVLKQ